MRQLVLAAPGELRLETAADPEPGPGQVRVAVHAAGVCGSDVHGYRGLNSRRSAGTVMGHEVSGVVVAAGPGVGRPWIGRGAVVNPLRGCGVCQACRERRVNQCPQKLIMGCTRAWPGGFADALIAPVDALVPWDADLPLAWATFSEPLAVGMQAAVAGDVGGRRVLVIGSGGVGVASAIASTARGASTTVLDRASGRRKHLADLGFAVVTPREVQLRPAFDVVIDCVASARTLDLALACSAVGSVVVVVGLARERARLNVAALVQGERTLRGSAQYTVDTFNEAVAAIVSGRVDVASLLAPPVPLAEGASLFAAWGSANERFVRTLLQP